MELLRAAECCDGRHKFIKSCRRAVCRLVTETIQYVMVAVRSLTHSVLGAVGVELQRVQALRRAGNLSLHVSTEQAVRHERSFTYSQDLQQERERCYNMLTTC